MINSIARMRATSDLPAAMQRLHRAYAMYPRSLGLYTIETHGGAVCQIWWHDSASTDKGIVGSFRGGYQPGADRYWFVAAILTEMKRLRSRKAKAA